LEADDEDTQDGDSLNHLKLDTNLTELTIKEDVAVESPLAEGAEVATDKLTLAKECFSSCGYFFSIVSSLGTS